MDEEIERLVIGVRADTSGFARDVEAMRGQLEGPLALGAERAGRLVENALVRAARQGKIGFDDLRAVAMAALADIAGAAIRAGIGSLVGGGGGGGLLGGLLGLLGAPGRATGGPVSPGRPYWVGERGPELFVPTTSGSVAAATAPAVREVRVAITVNAGAGESAAALQRSSRQVARAVRQSLADAG
jgi:hypothetical protein